MQTDMVDGVGLAHSPARLAYTKAPGISTRRHRLTKSTKDSMAFGEIPAVTLLLHITNTYGAYRRPPRSTFGVAICNLKAADASLVS
jgi:hypothetical protein